MRKLFSFKGRVGRLEFFLLSMAFGFLGGLISAVLEWAKDSHPPAALMLVWSLLMLALGVANLVALFAVYAKRFHDFGWSGWAVLIPIPLVILAALLAVAGAFTANLVCWIGAAIFGLGGAGIGIMLLFRSGDAGDNRFGSPSSGSVRS